MKKTYAFFFTLVFVFAFSFYTNKNINNLISNQIASVIGIEIAAVYDFSRKDNGIGLTKQMRNGDRGGMYYWYKMY